MGDHDVFGYFQLASPVISQGPGLGQERAEITMHFLAGNIFLGISFRESDFAGKRLTGNVHSGKVTVWKRLQTLRID